MGDITWVHMEVNYIMIQDGTLSSLSQSPSTPSADSHNLRLVNTALSRRQILDATARCLRRDGYDGATIRRIAAELDCAVGSIYRYFDDKRDLLFAVTQEALEPVAAEAEAGAAPDRSQRDYYRAATADRGAYQLLFWLAAVGAGRTQVPGENSAGSDVPPVISRIIAAWAVKIGETAAVRSWMALHAAITLGLEEVTALIAAGPQTPVQAAAPAPLPQPMPVLEPVVTVNRFAPTMIVAAIDDPSML